MASSTVETVNVHAWKRFIGNNCTGNIDLPGGHSSMGGLFRWYENVLMYDKISSPFKFIQIYPDWVHRSLIQSVQSVPPVRAIHVVVTQKWRTYFDSTSMPSPQIDALMSSSRVAFEEGDLLHLEAYQSALLSIWLVAFWKWETLQREQRFSRPSALNAMSLDRVKATNKVIQYFEIFRHKLSAFICVVWSWHFFHPLLMSRSKSSRSFWQTDWSGRWILLLCSQCQ